MITADLESVLKVGQSEQSWCPYRDAVRSGQETLDHVLTEKSNISQLPDGSATEETMKT